MAIYPTTPRVRTELHIYLTLIYPYYIINYIIKGYIIKGAASP